ncbi:MAG: Trk system potassium transporter TrkA [Mariprofundaceae bacterium]
MNVLILGAGEVGFHIAQRLASEGNNVVVVDNDPERLTRVADTMDVRTVLGHAAHPGILEQAGAGSADLLIAATINDEVNMIACQVAHSIFKVPTKMARVRNQEYVNADPLFGRDDLPIDRIISPEREAAMAVLKRIQVASAMDAQEFADGRVQLLGLKVAPKSVLAGLNLTELGDVMGDVRMHVVAIGRGGKWKIPQGTSMMLAGDHIYVAIDKKQLLAFLQRIGLKGQKRHNHVMMVGGGNVGYIVAQELERTGIHLKVIEHNRKRAEWLAENLNKSVVISGDALDRELLEEENIDEMDVLLALTNDDESNILASLIAKKYKVPQIVTLVNRYIYTDLVQQIGLDVTVSPRLTTVSSILRHIRKGRVLGISSLGDGSLEVIEAEALETSNVINVPLSELPLPADTVVAALVRGEEIIIPNGETRIKPHDHVLMVASSQSTQAIERLFEVHLEFF